MNPGQGTAPPLARVPAWGGALLRRAGESGPEGDRPASPAAAAPAARAPRHLCVVLHDVAPARWEACLRVLWQVRSLAAGAGVALPVTLLVVPMLHGVAAASPHYLRWLHGQAEDGHELALHGLLHRDDGPPPRGLREVVLRRFFTDGEGEFAALGRAQAGQRLALAQQWARRQGLQMPGFVPPAWLLNPAGWDAVAAAGFRYTCTLDRIVSLPERHALHARGLTFSNRAAWRRGASVAWNLALARRLRRAPLLRLELHPGDADHAAVRRCWHGVLESALQERTPLRLGEAAPLGTPPARGMA